MEIRFKLDPQLDAALREKILCRANGGAPSRAAYLLFNEMSAQLDMLLNSQAFPTIGPISPSGGGDIGEESDEMTDALDNLDEAWK